MKQQLISISKESGKEEERLNLLRKEYLTLKEQFTAQVESETLKKYKILSRAYKIGKLLFGPRFTIVRLCQEFNAHYTTVKRLLSLDRMTPKTKRLLHEGKISASQIAQICSTKNRHFQDEIVGLVVSKNLNSQDIKRLKPESVQDVNKYRLDKAIKSGFARQETAYKSFENALFRFSLFLESRMDLFPDSKHAEIKKQLNELKNKIELYLEKIK